MIILLLVICFLLIKYGITKEAFEDYNDITNIKPGDKVIIPKTSE